MPYQTFDASVRRTLGELESFTPRQLASALKLLGVTAQHLIDKLVEDGMIESYRRGHNLGDRAPELRYQPTALGWEWIEGKESSSPRRASGSPAAFPDNYADAKQLAKDAEDESRAAGAAMRAFPRLANGLTPDSVKASPEYRAAKARNDAAFAKLRRVNEWFVKTFKKEYAAERAARGR